MLLDTFGRAHVSVLFCLFYVIWHLGSSTMSHPFANGFLFGWMRKKMSCCLDSACLAHHLFKSAADDASMLGIRFLYSNANRNRIKPRMKHDFVRINYHSQLNYRLDSSGFCGHLLCSVSNDVFDTRLWRQYLFF